MGVAEAASRSTTAQQYSSTDSTLLAYNQQKYIWMLDTVGNVAYKIDTSNGTAAVGTVRGIYQTRPSSALEPLNPRGLECTWARRWNNADVCIRLYGSQLDPLLMPEANTKRCVIFNQRHHRSKDVQRLLNWDDTAL